MASPMQIIMFPGTDETAHYGELSDGHIFLGPNRGIKSVECSTKPPTEDWIAYATGRVFDIETPRGWKKTRIVKVWKTVVMDSGYTIPVVDLDLPALANHFPTIIRPDRQPSVPRIAPPAPVVSIAPAAAVTKKKSKAPVVISVDSDSDSDSVVVSYKIPKDDSARAALDALSAAVGASAKPRPKIIIKPVVKKVVTFSK